MIAVASRGGGDVLARIEPLAVNMRRSVSPLWRAACIGFATATVVLMGFGFFQHDTYDEALQAMIDGELADMIAREMGPQFKETFFSPTADHVSFVPVADNAANSGAVVMIDGESGRAFLACMDLPKIDGMYSLVVTDDQGQILKTIARFENAGELTYRPIHGGLAPGAQMAIYASPSPNEAAKPVLVSL